MLEVIAHDPAMALGHLDHHARALLGRIPQHEITRHADDAFAGAHVVAHRVLEADDVADLHAAAVAVVFRYQYAVARGGEGWLHADAPRAADVIEVVGEDVDGEEEARGDFYAAEDLVGLGEAGEERRAAVGEGAGDAFEGYGTAVEGGV